MEIKGIFEFLTSLQVSFPHAARQIQCADHPVSRFNSVHATNNLNHSVYYLENASIQLPHEFVPILDYFTCAKFQLAISACYNLKYISHFENF